jgi:nucleotide-binding universal stress UspA family protein
MTCPENEAMLPTKHILVPMDWSEPSHRAFHLAVAMAREHDAQLTLLYVVPLPALMYGPPPENYLDHLYEELCRMRPSDPKVRVQHLVAEGTPVATILNMARESGCDLIVMGTHGRHGLNRLLRGSVAEEVVRRAPCLVLTVRAGVPASLTGEGESVQEVENR